MKVVWLEDNAEREKESRWGKKGSGRCFVAGAMT